MSRYALRGLAKFKQGERAWYRKPYPDGSGDWHRVTIVELTAKTAVIDGDTLSGPRRVKTTNLHRKNSNGEKP